MPSGAKNVLGRVGSSADTVRILDKPRFIQIGNTLLNPREICCIDVDGTLLAVTFVNRDYRVWQFETEAQALALFSMLHVAKAVTTARE